MIVDGIDDRLGLGGCCRAVEVDEGLAVHRSPQDRELGTNGVDVENGDVSDQSISAR